MRSPNSSSGKEEVVAFKADASLIEAMKGLPNRSAFIRQAILAALENSCPLCGGTGVLTPHQREHWDEFAADHGLVLCSHCDEVRLVCNRSADAHREMP
jgi:hypothetical protein